MPTRGATGCHIMKEIVNTAHLWKPSLLWCWCPPASSFHSLWCTWMSFRGLKTSFMKAHCSENELPGCVLAEWSHQKKQQQQQANQYWLRNLHVTKSWNPNYVWTQTRGCYRDIRQSGKKCIRLVGETLLKSSSSLNPLSWAAKQKTPLASIL